MNQAVFHILNLLDSSERPERFTFPFSYTPHPWAERAAGEVMTWARTYMESHPESELHRLGKMFGVLVAEDGEGRIGYLRAFSAMLDGTYCHEGFVAPVFDLSNPDGYFKQEEARITAINRMLRDVSTSGTKGCEHSETEIIRLKTERKQRSQALQRWMFSQYRMLNAAGEEQDLLKIFEQEKPILSEEEFFSGKRTGKKDEGTTMPPSGAGECCAPKLLQQAFLQGLKPLCMAEFWMGASPKNELRKEGTFYPACQSKCKPILRHMLSRTPLEDDPVKLSSQELAEKTAILYEDEWMLVADKPSGLLTAPGAEGAYSLRQWAEARLGTAVWPVHRLDMDTSGIVVLAKTEEAYKRLQQLFLRRDIFKRYEAVVRFGEERANAPRGIISLPLLPDPFDRPRQMVNREHGKAAVTRWEIAENRADGSTLLHLYPQTGRTHQLRVHCAHPEGLGAPILGDRLYGDSRTADRLMLHAAEIRFEHPYTGEEMHIVAPTVF